MTAKADGLTVEEEERGGPCPPEILLGWDSEVPVVFDGNFEISVIGKEAGVTLGEERAVAFPERMTRLKKLGSRHSLNEVQPSRFMLRRMAQ